VYISRLDRRSSNSASLLSDTNCTHRAYLVIEGGVTQTHRNCARNQLGRIVREVPKEVLPQALLSDAVAKRASLTSVVKGCNW
jgi:hypothetical protein